MGVLFAFGASAELRPDLMVKKLSVSDSPMAGVSATITAVVKNQGTTNTKPFAVRFYVDGSAVGEKVVSPSGGLYPGENSTEEISYTVTSPGDHLVRVEADVYDSQLELDETNNAKESTVFWAVDPEDLDSDQIKDSWEKQHFGSVSNCDPTAVCSNGVNTLRQAYIAGLDPKDPGDKLLLSVFRPQSSVISLEWTAVSGRVYSVLWTTNLQSGFQALETNIAYPTNSWTVTNAFGKGCYRLEVELMERGAPNPPPPPPPM